MNLKRKKLAAWILAAVMCAGLCVPFAAAYDTADFSDVATTHWAYSSIMEMADKGIIKGVGNGLYAPADTLTVGSFLALIGRALYPGECVETDTWWEVYYNLADSKLIIIGERFTAVEYTATEASMNAAITRNEMARILIRADENLNKHPAIVADTSKITDYASIPSTYQKFVAQAYEKGLLTGDQNGNFNGSNTLTRAEAATVIKRLLEPRVDTGVVEVPEGKENYYMNPTSVSLDNNHDSQSIAAFNVVGRVSWTVSEEGIIKITPDSDGGRGCVLVALASGTVTVTATDQAGRSVSCIVTSTYVRPEAPKVLTGRVETVNVRVSAVFADTREYTYVAGVTVVLYHASGQELGRTVTGEDGQGFVAFDVDKAYYDEPGSNVYAQATYIDPDGNRYSNILLSGVKTKGPLSLWISRGFTVYLGNDSGTYFLNF